MSSTKTVTGISIFSVMEYCSITKIIVQSQYLNSKFSSKYCKIFLKFSKNKKRFCYNSTFFKGHIKQNLFLFSTNIIYSAIAATHFYCYFQQTPTNIATTTKIVKNLCPNVVIQSHSFFRTANTKYLFYISIRNHCEKQVNKLCLNNEKNFIAYSYSLSNI